MASTIEMSQSWSTLSGTIRRVRNRWRARIALHGLTIVVGVASLLLIGLSWLVSLLHFNGGAIIAMRVVAYATFLTLIVWYIVLPLRRRTTDAHVALYLEEHDPSLDAVLVSAVDTGIHNASEATRSPYLVNRIVEMAATKIRARGTGSRIESRGIMTSLMALAGMLIGMTLLMTMGPAFMRTGAYLLAAPISNVRGTVFITVQPGNAAVSRGGDQAVRAQLHGFGASSVELVVQRGGGKWERISMTALRDSGIFAARLFDLRERTNYYVEAEGLRSPTYHLDVTNLPYTKSLTLDLHYPAFTGLPVKIVNPGGDVSILRGGTVVVHVTPTMPVVQAWLVVDGKPKVPMTQGSDGRWNGAMTVTARGFYHIELAAAKDNPVLGSLNYTIDALEDGGPTIKFLKPGHDVGPDSLAAVFSQFEATDDYGIKKAELRYMVNGDTELVVPLYNGTSRKSVIAAHTFFLDSLRLKPGDNIAYYAEATDNALNGGHTTQSDMYFVSVNAKLDIRRRKGPPSPASTTASQLARKQQKIIAATFKVDRDRASLNPKTLADNMTTLSSAQEQLQDQTKKVQREFLKMGNSIYKSMAAELGKALPEMTAAQEQLTATTLRASIPAQQRAVRYLLRAEYLYRKRDASPAKGKREENIAKDIADLLTEGPQNNTETKERPQARTKAMDELREKLDALAQRFETKESKKESLAEDARNMAEKADALSKKVGGAQGQVLKDAAERLRKVAIMLVAAGSGAKEVQNAAEEVRAVSAMLQRYDSNGEINGPQRLLERASELVRVAASLDDRLNNGNSANLQSNRQQFARELQDQRETAEALRRDVKSYGADVKGLDNAIGSMRILERDAARSKLVPEGQTKVVEALKTWEFEFRKRFEGSAVARPTLGDVGDAPPEYKSLVDEYYRSLSKTR